MVSVLLHHFVVVDGLLCAVSLLVKEEYNETGSEQADN